MTNKEAIENLQRLLRVSEDNKMNGWGCNIEPLHKGIAALEFMDKIVYCKDCKYHKECMCDIDDFKVLETGFCSEGEKEVEK